MKVVKRMFSWLGTVISVMVIIIATILALSVKWMFKTWANLSIDELLFHLKAPLEGTNQDMILEYINVCIVPAIVVLLLYITVLLAFRKTRKYWWGIAIGVVLSLLAGGGMLYNAWLQLDVEEYVEAKSSDSDFIKEYYVDPVDTEITFPEQKRNLIYIFLESMETTYADTKNGGSFEKNVIPELTEIAQENEDFSGEDTKLNGAYPMTGATWTIAGMFAQTAGLPLNISIEDNAMDTQEKFFPGIINLGDILEQEGYSQTLMIGSEAGFGGRELYFREHGNYDIIDYNYALENGMLPSGYRVWWGFEDQKLFGFAKEKLLELAEQDNPFNFTMLTVDTHFEDGCTCEKCPSTFGDDQYANVMACSSRQVKEFIEWIKEQDFYENTTIVVTGDHLTMDSDFCTDIDSEYERKTYTSYINSAKTIKWNDKRFYTTFDHFPTTLSSLGVEIEGNRLGLGTDLFSGTPTLIEKIGYDQMNKKLKGNSPFLERVAQIDKDSKELMRREGRLPIANVWTEEYQYEMEGFPVLVSGISGISNEIASVTIAVWTAEDKSDMQWLQLDMGIDAMGECYYYGYVNIQNFGYKTGEYQIQAYVIDNTGTQYQVGETCGMVY